MQSALADKYTERRCLNCNAGFVPWRFDQSCCCLKCTAEYHDGIYARRRAAGLCVIRTCDALAELNRVHCEKHGAENNQRRAANTVKWKREAFEAYGGSVCVGCWETDIVTLSLDHEKQDGHLHRKEQGTGARLYRWVKAHGYPPGFRVLCMNCQFRARAGAPLPKEFA